MVEDANKTRQIHLTFEVVGSACQNIAENQHIRGKRKSLLVIQIQEALWRNNLKPDLAATKICCSSLDQRANPADQKQNPQKINTRVMASQYEASGKNQIC